MQPSGAENNKLTLPGYSSKRRIAGLAIFILKKVVSGLDIWPGLDGPQPAQLIPAAMFSLLFRGEKLISGLNIEKLCSAHTSKTQILLELLGPSCRPLLVQFSRLLTTPSFPVYNAQFKNLTNQGRWRVVEYFL